MTTRSSLLRTTARSLALKREAGVKKFCFSGKAEFILGGGEILHLDRTQLDYVLRAIMEREAKGVTKGVTLVWGEGEQTRKYQNAVRHRCEIWTYEQFMRYALFEAKPCLTNEQLTEIIAWNNGR